MPLSLENLSKGYPQPAVRNISLDLAHGEILSLLGPSGCGKTSLLRLVAGLETPDRGRVLFDGRDMTGLPPHKRRFGLMFQEYALFPHLNVADNVAFGLRMQKRPRIEIGRRVAEMLELTGLSGLAGRGVSDLSGGERQRVALARSLAPRPRLLMLDEPLASLDRALRERLLEEIRGILKLLALPALFVTHDQAEAMAVADRIAVMNRGRLEQVGSPEMLYRHPANPFVARFLGFHNLLPGVVTAEGAVATNLGILRPARVDAASQSAVTVVLRPECARLAADQAAPSNAFTIRGLVATRVFGGQLYRLTMRLDQNPDLVFDLPSDPPPPLCGHEVTLVLNPEHMTVMASG